MNPRSCTYEGHRDEQMVACLYGEIGSRERAEFERHVATCLVCSEELAALGTVRARLGQWTPPTPVRTVTPAWPPALDAKVPARARVLAALGEIPRWAQVAAALLFVGVAAGIANLDVRYDQRGLSVRTGWPRQSPAALSVGEAVSVTPSVQVSTQPWRADLADLERQLRTEFRMTGAPPAARQPTTSQGAVSEADLVRVRSLVEESQRRQQRELALRLAEAARDVEVQRRADLEKIDYMIQSHLGAMQNTGVEVMRQRRMINDLAVRVAQRQ